MATFHLTVTNEKGSGLNGVIISGGQYNTSPASWTTTSGPGGPWEGTTNSSGVINSDVKYTCPGAWTGTLKADGYDDYPYSYQSGNVTGDFYDTVQMVQSSVSGGAPNNSGANQKAGDVIDQGYATTEGLSLGTNMLTSNVFGGLGNFLSGIGLYVAVGLVALAIIGIVIVLVIL